MKKLLLATALVAVAIPSIANARSTRLYGSGTSDSYTYVQPYTRDNGTYVQPHYRTAPDGNAFNNWSTKGNVNPFTGQAGTKDPW